MLYCVSQLVFSEDRWVFEVQRSDACLYEVEIQERRKLCNWSRVRRGWRRLPACEVVGFGSLDRGLEAVIRHRDGYSLKKYTILMTSESGIDTNEINKLNASWNDQTVSLFLVRSTKRSDQVDAFQGSLFTSNHWDFTIIWTGTRIGNFGMNSS